MPRKSRCHVSDLVNHNLIILLLTFPALVCLKTNSWRLQSHVLMTRMICIKTSHFVVSVYLLLFTCLLLMPARVPDYLSLLELKAKKKTQRKQMPPKRQETDTLRFLISVSIIPNCHTD